MILITYFLSHIISIDTKNIISLKQEQQVLMKLEMYLGTFDVNTYEVPSVINNIF